MGSLKGTLGLLIKRRSLKSQSHSVSCYLLDDTMSLALDIFKTYLKTVYLKETKYPGTMTLATLLEIMMAPSS